MQTYNQQQTQDVNGYDQVTQPAPDARDFLGSQPVASIISGTFATEGPSADDSAAEDYEFVADKE